MLRRALPWIELGIAIPCLAVTAWSLSGRCAGFPLTFDCESWFIFSVNLFAPVGAVALISAIWSFRSRSLAPHVVLGVVVLIVASRFLLAAL